MAASEVPRQLVHISVGLIALTLRWLTWPQAAALAVAAILFNLFVLPHVSPRVFRPSDRARRWSSGIVLYPIAVLALILIFRDRLELAAACWGILAAGDGMATLVGTTVPSPRLPWNPVKSTNGLIAFVLSASAAGVALLFWVSTQPPAWPLVASVVCGAVAAALVETIPIGLDDNVSVPAAAALVVWSGSVIDVGALEAAWTVAAPRLPAAIAVNALVAAAGWLARTVTLSGAVAGAVIGIAIVAGAGWPGWALLMLCFLAAVGATLSGRRRKAAAGIAEGRGGRRGVGNAVANTGLGAWTAMIALGLPNGGPAMLAMAAALITTSSDTVASEVGKAYGRTTWLITRLQIVPAGTTGAISVAGTVAGLLSAAALAIVAAGAGIIASAMIPIVVGSACVASLVEGAIGATLEARGLVNNDVVNFLNSLMGAAIALSLSAATT